LTPPNTIGKVTEATPYWGSVVQRYRKHLHTTNHRDSRKKSHNGCNIYSALAHLSQELIEHTIQARNQLARAQYELDRIHQVTKLIVDIHEDLGKDLGYAQLFK
jgi:hypothetical protein